MRHTFFELGGLFYSFRGAQKRCWINFVIRIKYFVYLTFLFIRISVRSSSRLPSLAYFYRMLRLSPKFKFKTLEFYCRPRVCKNSA